MNQTVPDARRDLDVARQAGLQRRHARKLAIGDAAALEAVADGRCHYLVEEPDRLCPNASVPGCTLCRPHLVRAAELARRLGLYTRPDGEQP